MLAATHASAAASYNCDGDNPLQTSTLGAGTAQSPGAAAPFVPMFGAGQLHKFAAPSKTAGEVQTATATHAPAAES